MNTIPKELHMTISDTTIELTLLDSQFDFNAFFILKAYYKTSDAINYYGENAFGQHIFITTPFGRGSMKKETEMCLTLGTVDYYYNIIPTYTILGIDYLKIGSEYPFIKSPVKENLRQMTLSEIEKELGYKIQLVEDDE